MKKNIFILSILLIISFLVSPCFSKENDLVIKENGFGVASVKGDKLLEARNDALNKAISSAYGNALLSIFTDKNITEGFSLISRLLESDPSTLMEDFQVLGDAVNGDKYHVAVKASFNRESIEKQLKENGIAFEKTKLPNVILLVSQKGIEDFFASQWWHSNTPLYNTTEQFLGKSLSDRGFTLIPPYPVKKIEDGTPVMEDTPDKKEAINIAIAKGAELVIVGKASALPGGNKIGGNETIKVLLSIMVFKTDSGEEVLSFNKEVVVTSLSDFRSMNIAFEKAGTESGGEIAEQIYTYWNELHGSKREILMEITGDEYLPRFIRFKTELEKLNLVSDMTQKEISSNGSIISAGFKGSTKELAIKIAEVPFESFAVEISEISDEKMKIKFISPK